MLYAILYPICKFLFKLFFKLEIEGIENVPREGGIIVVANHVSLLDPIILGVALNRPVYFMAKEELFKNPVLGFVISRLNAFPVRRGSVDRRAIERGLALLREGKVLGMFPEGKRSKDGLLSEPHHGPTTFAYKTGAPILPAALIGTGEVLRKGSWMPRLRRVRVRIGKALSFTKPMGEKVEKTEIREASRKMMDAISSLLATEGEGNPSYSSKHKNSAES